MKKKKVLKFSKEILRNIELIAKCEQINPSVLINIGKLNTYIATQKNKIIKELEGMWMLDKINEKEFKKFTRYYPSNALKKEKETRKFDAELYKENARKALLMNFCEN